MKKKVFFKFIVHLQVLILQVLCHLLLVVSECTDSALGPVELGDRNHSPALALAGVFAIDVKRVLWDARAALEGEQGSAAGAARRWPTPTEAFISQHGAAAGGAGTNEAA